MQEPAEAALKHRLIIALKHTSSSTCGSDHWFSLYISLSSLPAVCDLHGDLSGDNLRLHPQAHFRQRCSLLCRQLQDCLHSVTLPLKPVRAWLKPFQICF